MHHIRIAARTMARSPGFAIAAVFVCAMTFSASAMRSLSSASSALRAVSAAAAAFTRVWLASVWARPRASARCHVSRR